MEITDTEKSLMIKAQKMIEEVVPGNNLQGLVNPEKPELIIKKKGTAVVSIKITLTFDLDTEMLQQKPSEYKTSFAAIPRAKANNNGQ